MQRTQVHGMPGGNFTTSHYVVVIKVYLNSYVEMHKTWPKQHKHDTTAVQHGELTFLL